MAAIPDRHETLEAAPAAASSPADGIPADRAASPDLLPSEEQIASLLDRWNAALLQGDPEAVVDLYAEPSILLATFCGTPRLSRGEKLAYFERFLQRRPHFRVEMRQLERTLDLVVDSGICVLTLAAESRAVRVRYSLAYRRVGSEWRIASHHSSLEPPPD
jgi:uncharacterized protein (TIGR02246 family)